MVATSLAEALKLYPNKGREITELYTKPFEVEMIDEESANCLFSKMEINGEPLFFAHSEDIEGNPEEDNSLGGLIDLFRNQEIELFWKPEIVNKYFL